MNILTKSILLAASAAVFLSIHTHQKPVSPYRTVTDPPVSTAPFFASHWVSQQETRESHSASMTLAESKPVVVWYGGTEEGHADVALFISTFDRQWSKPTAIVDRQLTEDGLNRFIRKVGNPVIHAWPDGAWGLFYVSVSVGGWGGSAINYIESTDSGRSWGNPRRLVTSPFLNISTLVRTEPQQRTDGTLDLPIYHEFIGKFAETLHLTRDLQVLDKRRLSWGTSSLQPAIATIDGAATVSMVRYAGKPPGRVLAATSADSGQTWTRPEKTSLPNPNSAVALLNTGNGNLLMALNDTEDGRARLSLASKTPDGQWKIIKVLEEETDTATHEFEFSYPSMTMDAQGIIHLVYTWNQKRIKHLRFNQAWLDAGQTQT